MSESTEQYLQSVTLLEDMVEFHPDFLTGLSDDDHDILSRYYFAGREIDGDELMAEEPGIVALVKGALGRIEGLPTALGISPT